MKFLRVGLVALAGVFGATASVAEPFQVIYPAGDAGDRRQDYPLALVELALTKAGAEYEVIPKPRPANNKRLAQIMASSGDFTIAFMGARPELEEALRTIYFPVFRGLLGNRIAITHKDNLPKLDEVDTADEFLDLAICQGLGWSDTAILESGGFNVVTGQYANLFKVANGKRCDAYLRAVFEPYAEVESRAAEMPDLVVDDSIMIRYHLPLYFFVAPSQEEMAQAIERGLQIALEDGSFRELFENAPLVVAAREAVKAENRVCYDMDNPFLSDASRALPEEYWGGFSFGDAGSAGDCRRIN